MANVIPRIYVEEEYVKWVIRILTEDLGHEPSIDEVAEKIGDILVEQKEKIESNREEADEQELTTLDRDGEDDEEETQVEENTVPDTESNPSPS